MSADKVAPARGTFLLHPGIVCIDTILHVTRCKLGTLVKIPP